jgi:ParB family transcriptional regulator, chromosome partitioning protein
MPVTKLIPLADIDPPAIPARVAMDDAKLRELMDSMRATGQVQAIAVKDVGGRYEIIIGHRRYVAASALGWETLRAEVFAPSELKEAAAMLAENIYREDLNAAEEALLFAEHRDKYNLDEAGLCEQFHVGADYLGDRFRLLRGDKRVFDALLARHITFAVARELNKCPDADHRGYLLDVAVSTGYSARVMADHVRQWRQNTAPPPAAASGTVDAAPVPPAAEYKQECVLCGGYRDPWEMVSVMIHKRELDAILEQLRRAAVDVG